jgi:hypothetical protein
MSDTRPQQHVAAPAEASVRGHWEWFWRIIAGLMLITIGWVGWVAYQIMPRSVATPLAYESQIKPGGTAAATQQGAAPAMAQSAPVPSAADLAMEQAQAAMRDGAHQASADVQAAAMSMSMAEESGRGERLKLSTEITTPLAEGRSPSKRDGSSGAAPVPPAAAETAGRAR